MRRAPANNISHLIQTSSSSDVQPHGDKYVQARARARARVIDKSRASPSPRASNCCYLPGRRRHPCRRPWRQRRGPSCGEGGSRRGGARPRRRGEAERRGRRRRREALPRLREEG